MVALMDDDESRQLYLVFRLLIYGFLQTIPLSFWLEILDQQLGKQII